MDEYNIDYTSIVDVLSGREAVKVEFDVSTKAMLFFTFIALLTIVVAIAKR